MAKKDFDKLIGSKEKTKATTRNYYSKQEQAPKKKFKATPNKTRYVSIRVTEEQYNNLIELVEKNKESTISSYVIKTLKI